MIRLLQFGLILFCIIGFHSRLSAVPPDRLRFHFIIQNEQPAGYIVGDRVNIMLTATQAGKACESGLEKSRFFGRGVRFVDEGTWKKSSEGVWFKLVTVVITGNKKNLWQITAFRKTDQGDIVESITLKQALK